MREQIEQNFGSQLESELDQLELSLELKEQALRTRIAALAAEWNPHALPTTE